LDILYPPVCILVADRKISSLPRLVPDRSLIGNLEVPRLYFLAPRTGGDFFLSPVAKTLPASSGVRRAWLGVRKRLAGLCSVGAFLGRGPKRFVSCVDEPAFVGGVDFFGGFFFGAFFIPTVTLPNANVFPPPYPKFGLGGLRGLGVGGRNGFDVPPLEANKRKLPALTSTGFLLLFAWILREYRVHQNPRTDLRLEVVRSR
jgi:hypothetical protein